MKDKKKDPTPVAWIRPTRFAGALRRGRQAAMEGDPKKAEKKKIAEREPAYVKPYTDEVLGQCRRAFIARCVDPFFWAAAVLRLNLTPVKFGKPLPADLTDFVIVRGTSSLLDYIAKLKDEVEIGVKRAADEAKKDGAPEDEINAEICESLAGCQFWGEGMTAAIGRALGVDVPPARTESDAAGKDAAEDDGEDDQ